MRMCCPGSGGRCMGTPGQLRSPAGKNSIAVIKLTGETWGLLLAGASDPTKSKVKVKALVVLALLKIMILIIL